MSMKIAQAMPVLYRHRGVWEGVYRRFTAAGDLQQTFNSRLFHRFYDDAHWPRSTHQTNIYWLPGGTVQVVDSYGDYRDGRMHFDGDRAVGWIADDAADANGRSTLLYLTYPHDPSLSLYQATQISDCGQYRTRVAQYLRDGRTATRTLIDEHLVTQDWAAFEAAGEITRVS
jgi:hypothetical protein